MKEKFSFFRLVGLINKEITQLMRDRSTLAFIVLLPILQIILFGYAINTNPKNLPSALINLDNGPFGRTLVHQLENTQYFRFNHLPRSESDARNLIMAHQVLFVLNIPTDFSRKIIRNEKPQVLLEVDGTDPVSIAYAISASQGLMKNLFQYDLIGPLSDLNPKFGPAVLQVHTKYNPNAITQYNIVPGILGIVLTLSGMTVAAMALTRERERGTMEALLATPLTPLEVILGKGLPFVFICYLQLIIVIVFAFSVFGIPMRGDPIYLFIFTLPFIFANLAMGMTISTLAKSQVEASQICLFIFMPSLLLSGFAFPFQGMPLWAQWIGNVLPMTHFINIVRGITLKGIGLSEIWVDLWPLLLFMLVMVFIALKRYHQTLD